MSSDFWTPIRLSVEIASMSVVFVFIFGLLSARFMAKKQFFGKTAAETLLTLPLVLPPTVVGFILIIIFGINSPIGRTVENLFGSTIMFTWWAAVIAASVVAFPLMYQSAKTGFLQVDPGAEEAARVDGANEWKVFWYVTLPLSSRTIVTGLILSFARALGEFGATLMFAGNLPGRTQTAPTAIYMAIESGNLDAAWLWVIAMVGISFLMLLSTSFLKQ
ncbi:molybdate ABC transporter permease subunit [Mesobacillus sp. AQ2]|jgi:molybdate transport system permease protein|uniref:molybdate ABC transporter permease subunit n=1 Tax=unclassified Mesobacillus TaxID=2675270 RepID=UPI00203EA78C|nr:MULTISPECIES: molybdate ABC transporter permease subunit [unclassified Mesobacillus]MCM3121967.1 molybdate ABC transporter permease subunit [Mesobacillus sp. MER 33]MCM3231931.1 molybdate ABC transporter permease subunit [Mesobacillus sp. MER 48]WHX38891.1 molybdate ABC transporter permease subunit [Mesobacillus sp. AQ2]